MPITPSREDDQIKPEHTAIVHRENRKEARRRRRNDFYSDEHPEVPRARRASLQYDRSASSYETPLPPAASKRPAHHTKPGRYIPPATDRHSRKLASHEHEYEDERDSIPETPSLRTKEQSAHSRRPYLYEPRKDAYEYERERIPTTPPSDTNKISVARRKQSEQPVTQHARKYSERRTTQYARKQNTLPTGIPSIPLLTSTLRQRPFIFIGVVFIVVGIILSLTVPSVLNNLYSLKRTVLPGNAVEDTSSSQSTAKQQAANARQLVIVPSNTDRPAPPVFATSAYLLDADTGATLYAYNPFMRLPMLSTTKLMTALLAAEQGNPDQQITITNAIANDIKQLSADSSVMGIKKGETYTLRELLYGLFLVSGNDAAIAIADGLSGNMPAFVAKMNQRAAQLGMNDTHYMNPHGLLMPGHYSSAYDLAILGKVSLTVPLLRAISGTREYRITKNALHAEHSLINGNQFLWWYPGVDAGKPGWDGNANFVQVISCVRNKHRLIGVTMHTKDWWTDMRNLMNWGFNTFTWISPADVDRISGIPFDANWDFFTKDKKNTTIPTADKGRYYIYTGYSISGPILAYFDKNGGLKKFGYPNALPRVPGNTSISQRFERGTIQCDTITSQCRTV